MRRLVYLASVRRDLLAILDYVAGATGNVSLAQGFVDELRAKCRELASLPGMMGRPRAELHPEIRSSTYKGYVIFFRYVQDRIEIVDILEGHRDIDEVFAGRE